MTSSAHTAFNPFIHGYTDLSVERLLAISYEDDTPLTYLPLHTSQTDLTDDQVARHACIFCDDFALITEGHEVTSELDAQCANDGIVRTVVYAVMAINAAGQPLHIGDVYTAEAAREVVQRLSFQTGFYSRAWEINTAHLPASAVRYIEELAFQVTLTGRLFEVFLFPHSPVIGIKLIATPWTDANLVALDGQTADQLRNEHHQAGVPTALIDVLFLAASADTRFLLFDPDAPILDGLPLYE
ncbi:MAG TPA: ABC transporter substrate-binding protein [Spongiibacteraceae bacterium]|nr:ABC transporter substrate-binding protein [Spongiibacteraceae bacterium]